MRMKIRFGSCTNLDLFFDEGEATGLFDTFYGCPSSMDAVVEADDTAAVRELAESYGGEVVPL